MVNSAFKDSLDIANRACDHLGVPHILAIGEDSTRYQVMSSVYDKLRQYELRRNIWRFSKRKVFMRPIDPNTRRLSPALWNSTYSYQPGAIVQWSNGDLFVTFETDNVGHDPSTTDNWEAYYGSQAVLLYDPTITYYEGELVYMAGSLAGSFIVYLSLVSGNSPTGVPITGTTPNVTTAYDATVTYDIDDMAYYAGFQWRSTIAFNLNNSPAVAPSDWSNAITYGAAATATGSDGYVYTSIAGSNLDNDPVADTTHALWTQGGPYAWTRVPQLQPSGNTWLPLFCGLKPLGIDSLGMAIPARQGQDVHQFLLPAGYMREARLNPELTLASNDHHVYGDYIMSDENNILLAYAADITKVTRFDAMFCEMLAATIGYNTCERLTQSTAKQSVCLKAYHDAGVEARSVNSIEVGSQEPDEDPWITVRERSIVSGSGLGWGGW